MSGRLHRELPTVWQRETIRGRRVWSVLVAEVDLPHTAGTATALANELAGRFFGTLPEYCGGLVLASPVEPSCGYELHPTATSRVPLIRFGTPHAESRAGRARLVYPIMRGLLVGAPAPAAASSARETDTTRGAFTFEVTTLGARASFAIRVDGFRARLLGSGTSTLWRCAYLVTESLLHRVLVSRFLRRFAADLQPGTTLTGPQSPL